jgi:electron transfer flavoprotein beta subunit
VPEKIGNIDKNAVEAAVRLKETVGGTVQAMCLGPLAARDAFKDVLAMGVDEVTLIEDPFDGQAEAVVIVGMLQAAIAKRGAFDVIMCGFASDDGYTYQVGPRLAERLNLPLVSYARSISVADGTLKVDRDLEDRLQTVSVALPALISIAEEAFPPRRTTLMDAIKAKKKPVNVWHIDAELGLDRDALEAGSHVAAVTQIGVVIKRKQNVLKGQGMAEMADQLIDALLQDSVVIGGA